MWSRCGVASASRLQSSARRVCGTAPRISPRAVRHALSLPISDRSVALGTRRSFSSASNDALVAPHFFDRVLTHTGNNALYEATPGEGARHAWSYAQLLREALRLRDEIQQALPVEARKQAQSIDGGSVERPRVAYLGSRSASYVTMQWATWLAGAVAVPLHPAHPVEELQYILDDSGAALLLVSDEFSDDKRLASFIQEVHTRGRMGVLQQERPAIVGTSGALDGEEEAIIRSWVASYPMDRVGAHIVYTSGTTGRPKGVVTTHAGLTAQIHDVVSAWEMSERDHLLHFLPLHHVHGILNNLLCVHYAGGSLEFLPSAKPSLVWSKLAGSGDRPVSMLMAVPTVYMNLLEELEREQQNPESSAFSVDEAIASAQKLRVAISGSMACPVSILNRWKDLTGHRLLERYGMTELGMALTNPLHGERHLGYVGQPFPSVQVRLVDADTEAELDLESELEGELRVKGPIVFREYWGKPEATAKEFDADGWFKTGDIAQYSASRASFRIRGRASADIIKSAGYKLSALDIERVLLSHPQIQECAVFGIADEKWGQIVAAMIRASSSIVQSPEDFSPPLVDFARSHMADYRVPRKYIIVDEIPKNAMGKVNKKSLAKEFS